MADIVTPEVRSRIMSAVRSRGTRPELAVRRLLHQSGFRYRLHRRDLPGTPDITLPRFGAVVFVHGCFWHGHGCALFKWPATREEFWERKIHGNINRDAKARVKLLESGWRVLVIWECALRGRNRLDLDDLMSDVKEWIRSERPEHELAGR